MTLVFSSFSLRITFKIQSTDDCLSWKYIMFNFSWVCEVYNWQKIKKEIKLNLKVSRNTFLNEHSIYFIKHSKVCLINFASEKSDNEKCHNDSNTCQ